MASFWRPHSFPVVLTSTNSISSPGPSSLPPELFYMFSSFSTGFLPGLLCYTLFITLRTIRVKTALFGTAFTRFSLFFYSPMFKTVKNSAAVTRVIAVKMEKIFAHTERRIFYEKFVFNTAKPEDKEFPGVEGYRNKFFREKHSNLRV